MSKKEDAKRYYEAHKEEILAKKRKRYAEDHEYRKAHKEQCKAYRENNPDYMKKWRENNPGYNKSYYSAHREECLQKNKTWNKEHPEERREHRKRYHEKKLEAWNPTLDEKILIANHRKMSYGQLMAGVQIGQITKHDLKKWLAAARKKTIMAKHWEERRKGVGHGRN